METRKATLKVNAYTYPVLVEESWTTNPERVVIDWSRVPEFFGSVPLQHVYDSFISDIGHDRDYWSYTEDAHCTYYVEPEWVTLDDPEEDVLPLPVEESEAAKRLRIVGNRLENGFAQEGLQLVRVEHSQDMNEGTITLHYRKEEV